MDKVEKQLRELMSNIPKHIKHKYLFADPVSDWHYWFAWFPIRTWDHRFIWLKKVERRLLAKHTFLSGPTSQWFEYHYQKGYL